ncbi:MAG TPA: hypothetical protein VF533_02195 [Solirubrobacteraceae bacterium]
MLVAPATGLGQTRLAALHRASPVSVFGQATAWSERSGGRFRLVVRSGGRRDVLKGGRGVPFDVDLGPGPDGAPVAVYSRCRREPRTTRHAGWQGVDWATGRGCDVYLWRPGRPERRLRAARAVTSEFLPGRALVTGLDLRGVRYAIGWNRRLAGDRGVVSEIRSGRVGDASTAVVDAAYADARSSVWSASLSGDEVVYLRELGSSVGTTYTIVARTSAGERTLLSTAQPLFSVSADGLRVVRATGYGPLPEVPCPPSEIDGRPRCEVLEQRRTIDPRPPPDGGERRGGADSVRPCRERSGASSPA